jgi:hypothetical protein
MLHYVTREMCLLNSEIMLNLNTTEQGVYHNGEAECLALSNLALIHAHKVTTFNVV